MPKLASDVNSRAFLINLQVPLPEALELRHLNFKFEEPSHAAHLELSKVRLRCLRRWENNRPGLTRIKTPGLNVVTRTTVTQAPWPGLGSGQPPRGRAWSGHVVSQWHGLLLRILCRLPMFKTPVGTYS